MRFLIIWAIVSIVVLFLTGNILASGLLGLLIGGCVEAACQKEGR